MTLVSQHWLTAIILLLIVVIIIDGIRRMFRARKDSIKMALRTSHQHDPMEDDESYGSEFPNGGARKSEQEIDKGRIQEARKRFNFGDDMPSWKAAVKAAGVNTSAEDTVTPRVEPSISDNTSLDEDLIQDSIEDIEDEPIPELSTEMEPLPEKDLTDEEADNIETPFEDESEEPIQASLDLDEAVPMLMDEVENDATVPASDDINNISGTIAEQASVDTPARSANKPRFESKYTELSKSAAALSASSNSPNDKEPSLSDEPQEAIVINLRAAEGGVLLGSDLLDKILENGLRFGSMGIFHRHAEEDGEGEVLFSMANLVKPGTFDLPSFSEFQTIGLSFFMTMPVKAESNLDVFELMLITAQTMAESLKADLLDEQRSLLTGQTIEHYRERIRDFTRRQQLGKV